MCIHRALQYLQNVLTEFSYLLINFCHLSLTFELGVRQRKYPWHSLISSIFELLNNFMHIRLYVKSRECRSPLLSWHDSRPYKRMGIHFLVISSKVTSSEAKFRILLKILQVRCFTGQGWVSTGKNLFLPNLRWYEEFLFTAAAVYHLKCANVSHISHQLSCPTNNATSVRLRQKI